jgi:hypothetical protein
LWRRARQEPADRWPLDSRSRRGDGDALLAQFPFASQARGDDEGLRIMNLDVVAEQELKTRRERLNALCLHQLT